MQHGRVNNDHADDNYFQKFNLKAQEDHTTKIHSPGDWKSSTDHDDYYQIKKTEVVEASPISTHLDTYVQTDETIIVEGDDSPDEDVPKVQEQVYVKEVVHSVHGNSHDNNVDMEAAHFNK